MTIGIDPRCTVSGENARRGTRHDEVGLARDKLGGKGWQARSHAIGRNRSRNQTLRPST